MRTGPEMLRKRGDLAAKKVDRMTNRADIDENGIRNVEKKR